MKNLLSLGTVLNKTEQQSINGGQPTVKGLYTCCEWSWSEPFHSGVATCIDWVPTQEFNQFGCPFANTITPF